MRCWLPGYCWSNSCSNLCNLHVNILKSKSVWLFYFACLATVQVLLTYHGCLPLQFRLDYALSREQTNKSGGKMYIQDKVEEYADEVFDLLENGAHIYFCGLKGMMPGMLQHQSTLCVALPACMCTASMQACSGAWPLCMFVVKISRIQCTAALCLLLLSNMSAEERFCC